MVKEGQRSHDALDHPPFVNSLASKTLFKIRIKLQNCMFNMSLTFVKVLRKLKKRQNKLNFITTSVVCKIKQGVNYKIMDYKVFGR